MKRFAVYVGDVKVNEKDLTEQEALELADYYTVNKFTNVYIVDLDTEGMEAEIIEE